MTINIVQQIEQVGVMLPDFAPTLAKYKGDLKRAGFRDSEAFILVRDYQMLLFGQNLRRESEES